MFDEVEEGSKETDETTIECKDPNCEICDKNNVCQTCAFGFDYYKGNCVLATCPYGFKPNDEKTSCVMAPSDDYVPSDDEIIFSKMLEWFSPHDGAERISPVYFCVMVTLSLTYFV